MGLGLHLIRSLKGLKFIVDINHVDGITCNYLVEVYARLSHFFRRVLRVARDNFPLGVVKYLQSPNSERSDLQLEA